MSTEPDDIRPEVARWLAERLEPDLFAQDGPPTSGTAERRILARVYAKKALAVLWDDGKLTTDPRKPPERGR